MLGSAGRTICFGLMLIATVIGSGQVASGAARFLDDPFADAAPSGRIPRRPG